jgi:2-amino-4-hydroxy-6-hydroxymethyldihydropteridine diphosphokinase
MKRVYLGLGTNLGNREANLARARELLTGERLRISRTSSVYETEPRDLTDQPWFLNQVLEGETTLLPVQLLERALEVEREMGRTRRVPKGPRVIDIDILFYGRSVVNAAPKLVIPHPRMAERRFVLEPLAELAPDLRDPARGRKVCEMLRLVTSQIVHRR